MLELIIKSQVSSELRNTQAVTLDVPELDVVVRAVVVLAAGDASLVTVQSQNKLTGAVGSPPRQCTIRTIRTAAVLLEGLSVQHPDRDPVILALETLLQFILYCRL